MLITRRFRTHSQSFVHIKNILEGYDNLATMTILEGSAGLLELNFDSSMKKELEAVIEGVRQELVLEDL